MGSTGTGAGGGLQANQESVIKWKGDTINLPSPLTYGTDMDLGKSSDKIRAFEAHRVSFKTEYGYLTDADGNQVGKEYHGGKGSVKFPKWAVDKATVLSHIHPREEGIIGGTFSAGDIDGFAIDPTSIMRAAAKEGTYSIRKLSNFDGNALNKDYKAFTNAQSSVKTVNAAFKKLSAEEQKATYSQYLESWAKAANQELIEMHNWLLTNAKKYGYEYVLERRT